MLHRFFASLLERSNYSPCGARRNSSGAELYTVESWKKKKKKIFIWKSARCRGESRVEQLPFQIDRKTSLLIIIINVL